MTSAAAGMHVGAQIGHEIDADDAAFVGDRLHRRVGDIARMVHQRARAGMADHQRPLGESDRFVDRPGAAVRKVEQQLFRLDPPDGVAPEVGKPAVGGLQRAVARLRLRRL